MVEENLRAFQSFQVTCLLSLLLYGQELLSWPPQYGVSSSSVSATASWSSRLHNHVYQAGLAAWPGTLCCDGAASTPSLGLAQTLPRALTQVYPRLHTPNGQN